MDAKNNPFPPELRTAAIVPRWSIVYTTQADTVSNHSYFVAIYAHMIAAMLDWDTNLALLMFTALLHDVDETITGDIVSPVKRQIIDQNRMDDFVEAKLMDRMGALVVEQAHLERDSSIKTCEGVDSIIKAADRLDALLFLIMEKRRGNTIIEPLIRDAQSKLEASWYELPDEKEKLTELWATVVIPSIKAHETEGGRGI